MQIIYLPVAEREHDEKLERIAAHPLTTHSIRDFLDDIRSLKPKFEPIPDYAKLPVLLLAGFASDQAPSILIR
jgi:hypothetical protein